MPTTLLCGGDRKSPRESPVGGKGPECALGSHGKWNGGWYLGCFVAYSLEGTPAAGAIPAPCTQQHSDENEEPGEMNTSTGFT